MSASCPVCGSTRVTTRNIGRKTVGTVGTVGGAVTGWSAANIGGSVGSSIGAVAGPVGMVVGGLAGALFGAIVGGASGAAVGSAAGKVIDDKVLDNFECLGCGHVFTAD